MRQRERKNSRYLHQIPGTATYVGNKEVPLAVEMITYSPETYQHTKTDNPKAVATFKNTTDVTWINVSGLNNTKEIEELGKHFDLHSLAIEDILNTAQPPKLEAFDKGLFVVVKMLSYKEEGGLEKEQLALFLDGNKVLSFQEINTGTFENLRKRIEFSEGKIRKYGADYLFYSILDNIVDDYFVVVDRIMDKVDALEDKLLDKNSDDLNEIIAAIQELKRELISVRRAVLPVREITKRLENTQQDYFRDKIQPYLRDLSDHAAQVYENVERCREIIWSLMEMYMAAMSNRMNEVMKVLTMMASIFIPLTFIAGIYGMNFDHMPELHFKNAYFLVLGIMLLIILLMLWYFRRKKWL